ncbi:hypothetical protein PHET_03617 [Paragonimus heterotremus]|uniref:Uncharacterized protein n=1 Tax=Paragonimus heterotremus TaxID=100268 RepID=A0A8J4X0Z7_9TREM|nr:hypothetical protein PHET_03617 [Paragonimus heterotremus]
MLSELLRTLTFFITLISTTIGDGEQTQVSCQQEGMPCSWLPTEICCEGTLCTNNRCTVCQLLGQSCDNSNECCAGVCRDGVCHDFKVLYENAQS